jgi:hypothetical protein
VKSLRLVLVGVILFVMAGTVVSARPIRVGLEFGNPTGVLIIRPQPFDIKVGYDFTGVGGGDADSFIHISTDYRIVDSYHLIDFLSLFLGAGGYVQFLSGADDDFILGGRIPVGLQAFLIDGTLEIFLELAPTVKLVPTITAFDDFQGYLGFTLPIPVGK